MLIILLLNFLLYRFKPSFIMDRLNSGEFTSLDNQDKGSSGDVPLEPTASAADKQDTETKPTDE